jgi:hypothetical protein
MGGSCMLERSPPYLCGGNVRTQTAAHDAGAQ